MGGLFGGDDDYGDCGGGCGGGEIIRGTRKVKKHRPPTPPYGFKGAGNDYKEEEEEDVDMGGLFGDDDDDYGCAYPSSSAPALRYEEIQSAPA